MLSTLDEKCVVPSSAPPPRRRRIISAETGAYLLAAALPVALLLGFVATKSAVLAHGTEVMVPVKVVDPYDPLRGSYLALDFTAPNLSEQALQKDFYVLYEIKDGRAAAVRVSGTKPALTATQFCLKGKRTADDGNRITYPFSKAFFNDKANSNLHSASDVVAKLRVNGDGEAVLVSVAEDPLAPKK